MSTLPVAAGVAWIVAATLTGYLALQQFGWAGSFVDDGTLQGLAIANGVAAALTVYFGIRCLTGPTRGLLTTLTAWGALNVAWGLYQIGDGATHAAYVGAVAASGVAGALCLAARPGAPEGPRRAGRGRPTDPAGEHPRASSLPPDPRASLTFASTPTRPGDPMLATSGHGRTSDDGSFSERYAGTPWGRPPEPPPPPTRSGRPHPIVLVAGLLAIAAVAGVAMIAGSGVLGHPGSASPADEPAGGTSVAPAGGTSVAPADPRTTALGKGVGISCGGDPCMVVSVDNVRFAPRYRDPDRFLDDTPSTKGNVFMAVHVTYRATGPRADYNELDWAVYVDDVAADAWTFVLHGPGPSLGSGMLPSGRSAAGWIVYEVPARGRVSVSYQPGLSGSIFEVTLRPS